MVYNVYVQYCIFCFGFDLFPRLINLKTLRIFHTKFLSTIIYTKESIEKNIQQKLHSWHHTLKILEKSHLLNFQIPREIPYWARICKTFKEPRNRFPAWWAGTTTLFDVPARQSPNFYIFKEPRDRCQGINSASLSSLAGRYSVPKASKDCTNIPAQAS